jgi:ring-1,2-phenylacetyl-CoA epoxidase subunit PaaA
LVRSQRNFIQDLAPPTPAEAIGLTAPDPKLQWNEKTRHDEFGEINWEEFKSVVSGNGPCNRERMRARIKADVDGHWVREAAVAYAEKHSNKN